MRLIDSHVHLDDDRLAIDFSSVLNRARDAGVIAQIVPATHLGNWERIQRLCAQHDDLFAWYVCHPCFMSHHETDHLNQLALWLGREKPVAVGECGLDYTAENLDKSAQQKLFAGQLSLAREFRLPVVIHAYKAVEDVIRMVRASGHYNGLVHSFSGSLQQAHRLIDLGYKLSFGGAITYSRATRLRNLITELPLDSIVLETDAPDQTCSQYKGMRNEPAYLIDVWQTVCSLRTESAEEIAASTTQSATELFALPVSENA